MQKYREQSVLFRRQNKEEHLLVKQVVDHKLYVLKRTDISHLSQEKAEMLEKQCNQLIQLKHPSLLKVKECFRDRNYFVQIIEYCGQQSLHERLSRKISVSLVTQYLLQLLFALHYLELNDLPLALDLDTAMLSSFGSLRLQLDLFSPKNWRDEVKALQQVIRKANLDWESVASHELQQILRLLMREDPPSIQQMINHPYLLKAMFDFCKQQEQEAQAVLNQEKLVKKKQMAKKSVSQPKKRSVSSQRQQNPKKPNTTALKKQGQPPVPPTVAKQKRNSSVSEVQFEQTQGKEELEELLQLYRNQLIESSKEGPNHWLVMSEIKETTEYDSTTQLVK